MSNLARIDWVILLTYGFVALAIASVFTRRMKTAGDFLMAGRGLPAWIAGLAIPGITLGVPVVIGMGAAGARYGVQAVQILSIGAIPAMLFASLVMMPVYYGSKARTIPEFLGLRFDQKTRVLSACLFAAMAVVNSAVSLYVMARVVFALHLFDPIFYALGWGEQGIVLFTVVASALLVMGVVLLGGFAGAVYNQALQLLLLIAAFLPLTLLALKRIGGWSGLRAALPAGHAHMWQGVLHAGANPMGLNMVGVGLGLGLVFGAGYWCADFRVLQAAMAARNGTAASRALLIAAAPFVLLPLLLITPGVVAIVLPTPHTSTVVREEGGIIFHDTTIVPKEEEAGHGLIPARVNPANGQILLDASGHPLLNYEVATPTMLSHVLPAGLLGLAIAALLASLVSGVTGNVTALNTVINCDLDHLFARKHASEVHDLSVARWTTIVGVLVAAGSAFALTHLHNAIGILLLTFAVVNAPLLALLLLGVFWKRATAVGAFAGILAGAAAALLHNGLALSIHAHPGIQGGWIAASFRYPNELAQNVWTAIYAFSASLLVAGFVSLITRPRSAADLQGLIFTPGRVPISKKQLTLASVIFFAALVVNVFLR